MTHSATSRPLILTLPQWLSIVVASMVGLCSPHRLPVVQACAHAVLAQLPSPMPSALLRPCREPLCPELVERGYCPRHDRSTRPADTRASSAARGYDAAHRGDRERWLEAHPLCGDRQDGRSGEHSRCARAHQLTPATVLDHIRPFRRADGSVDEQLRRDPANHQSLCEQCHNAKAQRERGRFANRVPSQPPGYIG